MISPEYDALNKNFQNLPSLLETPDFNFAFWTKKTFSKTVLEVDFLFQKVLKDFEILEMEYRKALNAVLAGTREMTPLIKCEEKIIVITKFQLSEGDRKYEGIWKLLKFLKKRKGIEKVFPLAFPPSSSPTYFLSKYFPVIVLRRVCPHLFPLDVIVAASRFDLKDLRGAYREQLEKWVGEIKKEQKAPLLFYKGVKGICHFINYQNSALETSLSLMTLAKNITEIWDVFLQKEKSYLKRMEKMIQQPLFHEGEELKIGKEISYCQLFENYRLYFIENRSDCHFWMPPNRLFLDLEQERRRQWIGGILPAQIRGHPDGKGRFALVEKLEPLKSVEEVTSPSLSSPHILLCIEYIRSFLLNPHMHTDPGQIENIGVNERGELRLYVLPSKETFLTLIKLEKLVCDFADSSLETYTHIVAQSGLGKKQRGFFKDVLHSALGDKEWFTETALALYGSSIDYEVIQRGHTFFNLAKEFKRTLLSKLSDKYEISQSEKTQACFQKIVCQLYEASHLMGRFWPTFEDQIEEEIVKDLKLSSLAPSTPVKFRSKKL